MPKNPINWSTNQINAQSSNPTNRRSKQVHRPSNNSYPPGKPFSQPSRPVTIPQPSNTNYSHENQSVSQQGQSTDPQPQSNIPLTQTNSPHTQSNSPHTQSNSPDTRSVARQSKSKNHKKKSNGHQTQSFGRQSPSTDSQSPSTGHPAHSTGRQSQANAPLTETFGLRDEETDIEPQSTDNTGAASQDETTETEAVSGVEKRKRGPTMGRGLMKAVSGSKGKKLKIEVDPAIGRPKHRLESAKFSSQVGVVARDVLPVVKKWKEIDVKSALDPCIDHMQIHMDPACVTEQEQWEQLCDHFNSPEFKNQSRANSNNRKKVQAKHSTGRTPFTIIQNEISRKKGDDCGAIELYKSTHENVNGKWSSNVAQENWELMMEKKTNYAEQGIDKSEQEIMTEVLGLANGYIKGLRYGPKPPCKRNSELQQELEETRTELEESRSDATAYKRKVDALTDQLKEQGSQIAKLMAFMEAGGHKNQEHPNQNQNQLNEDGS
ncbi:hypothetical protein CASFOL_014183 [Castilleja foliolosa]|uniref:Transposase, Ptta/En/Spm, plant n=1 Tax=Castilleja foliolosa TaxID=1961234 RepID=A0ABD3DMR7_9LAMI